MTSRTPFVPVTPLKRNSFAGIESLLYREDGKWVAGRPVGRNTYLERRGVERTIVLKLHQAEVMRWYPDNTVVLDSCGWLTHTTRTRMNDWLPLDSGSGRMANVWLDNGYWMVGFTSTDQQTALPTLKNVNFHDGMVIDLATMTEFTPAYDRNADEAWNQEIDRKIAFWEQEWPEHVAKGELWVRPSQQVFFADSLQSMRDQLLEILSKPDYPSSLLSGLSRYKIHRNPFRLVKQGLSPDEQRPLKDALRKFFRSYLYNGYHIRRTGRLYDQYGKEMK